MATTITEYDIAKKYRHNGTLDLDTATIKVLLLASTYTPNFATDAALANIVAHELAAGNGYTTGGVALASKVVDNVNFSAGNILFPALGTPSAVAFRYALLYASGTYNSIVDPLIALILPIDTPADVNVNASDYNLIWNPAGIITF